MTSSSLTEAERHALRAQLHAERAEMAEQVAALVRTFDELVAAADLEPPDDEHDPDGTTAYERAQVTSLADAARARLDDLDRALGSIDAGGFGMCERCRGPIGLDRLQALPGARRCIVCAQS